MADPIKQFLAELADPQGAYTRALYRSFPQSQLVLKATILDYALKYKMDPQVFVDADTNRMAEVLLASNL